MSDTRIDNIINGIFNTITLIDINNDKVTFLDGKNCLNEVVTNTYVEYYEKLKKVIHPDYLNSYFDTISLNNLQASEDYITCSYMKLSTNLNYEKYTDIIKLLDDNRILILTIRNTAKEKKQVTDNNISYNFADLIINIEQMLGNIKTNDYETENNIKYIKGLLNDAKSKNTSVLKDYESRVGVNVSKTFKTLVIADDDSLTRSIFKKVFEAEYNIIECKNGTEAVNVLEQNMVKVSTVAPVNIVGMFLDLKMPVMDGFGVLDYMKDKGLISRIPVIIISADDAKETKELVYSYDIADMIEKPFNFEIIKKRVNSMVSMYAKSDILNNLVHNQEKEIKEVLKKYVDTYLINHEKITDLANKYLDVLLDKLNEEKFVCNKETIKEATKFYELGINFVPTSYYTNYNKLDDNQKKLILDYPNVGSQIIKYVYESSGSSTYEYINNIILMHNERFDGLGFPYGLKEDKIPKYIYVVNMALELAKLKLSKKTLDEAIAIINSKSNQKYSADSLSILNASIEKLRGI